MPESLVELAESLETCSGQSGVPQVHFTSDLLVHETLVEGWPLR